MIARQKIWKVTDHLPLAVQKRINKFLNSRWPVWGYHFKDGEFWNQELPKDSFKKLEEFMAKNDTNWHYDKVKGYTHISIFDQEGAKKFRKKYNFK